MKYDDGGSLIEPFFLNPIMPKHIGGFVIALTWMEVKT
jgi:hypothetical protein